MTNKWAGASYFRVVRPHCRRKCIEACSADSNHAKCGKFFRLHFLVMWWVFVAPLCFTLHCHCYLVSVTISQEYFSKPLDMEKEMWVGWKAWSGTSWTSCQFRIPAIPFFTLNNRYGHDRTGGAGPEKAFNNVTRCRIAEQQKAGNQDRDDSIKQFSIQPHSTYLVTLRFILSNNITKATLYFEGRIFAHNNYALNNIPATLLLQTCLRPCSGNIFLLSSDTKVSLATDHHIAIASSCKVFPWMVWGISRLMPCHDRRAEYVFWTYRTLFLIFLFYFYKVSDLLEV